MKIRTFVIAASAALLALVSCNKEIDYGPAKVEVDKTTVEMPQNAGSVTVSLNATINWAAKVETENADWVDISPASGTPSLEAQALTIKVTENTGINREATILVQGDVLHKTYINVKQAGPKGDEDTCTVDEFIKKADKSNPYVLTGKVSGFNANYCSFDLTDETGKIYVYSIAESSKQLASTIKNGGTVKIKGYYDFYEAKSQHEVVNAEILSYEAPEEIDPSKIETITVAEFLEKADETTPYRLVGTVVSFSSQYTSFNLKDDTGSIYVYSIDDASKEAFADKLANGKTVTLYGCYYWYENSKDASKSKAEIMNAVVEKVEDGQGGGDDDYENAPKKTVAEFISEGNEDAYYKLTGKVSGFNSNYCSFDLTDETGKIYVYSVKNKDEWSSKIKNGGTVTLAGKYLYYEKSSKDEVVDAYILSFTEGEEGGGDDDDYANAPKKTVAEFLAAADEGTYYKLTGKVSDFYEKYCSFDLTDETGKVYVYSVKNKDEWSSKIKDGGTVTLSGKFSHYENTSDPSKSKDEVIDAYILSFTEGEGGGEEDTPTDFKKVTVAEFLAAEVSTTQWYQLTGEITSISNTQYGNFDLEDETGSVYVYGLTKAYVAKNDQSFAELGLKKGDIVTINALRSEHEGTAEAGGSTPAFYVSHVPGEEEKVPEGTVTLTFPDDNSANNKANNYENEWEAKSGAATFTIVNFNNYNWNGWTYIKCGRKANDSVASIATKTALTSKVAKVVVTLDSVEAKDVKSMKLIVASDANFSKDKVEVSATPAKGDVAFNVADPAEKLYYKIVFDCQASTLSSPKNGFVQISKVAYVAAE